MGLNSLRIVLNVIIATTLGLCLFVGYVFWYSLGPGRYSEFENIKRQLAEIPDVKVLNAGGNEDLTFEDIYATIDVNGLILTFRNLENKSFKHSSHIMLSRVGPYAPANRGCAKIQYSKMFSYSGRQVPERFYGTFIDIGEEGVFASAFEKKYNNVQSVISDANNLLAALEKWPRQPDEKYLEGPERVYSYWIEPVDPGAYDGPWKDLLNAPKNEDKFAALKDPKSEALCTSATSH